MAYLENALNRYDTYTYNISVWIANPATQSLFPEDVITNENTIKLMDNHTQSRYVINNLEHVYAVGFDRVRSGFGNMFQMSVGETSGVSLLNQIKLASDELGLPNYHEALYVIKVEFIGRNGKTGRSEKFTPSFYYSTMITKFDFTVDSGGTNYNIEFVERNTTAYHYLTNVIRDQITINSRTVGDFFTKFNLALERSMERIWLLNEAAAYIDTVRFEFDETTSEWQDWEFEELTQNYNTPGINIVGEEGTNELQITINNGSNLTEIFAIVLQLTAEYKKVLRTTNSDLTPDSSFKDEGPSQAVLLNDLSGFPIMHKVMATVKPEEYDPLRNEYQKTVTYTAHAYVVTKEIVSPDAYYRSITDTDIQRRRMRNLQASDLLRKRYDYLGTGLNTEVINLDLKFDLAYFYLVPHGGGFFGDSDAITPTATGDSGDPISRLRDAKREIVSLQRQQRAQQSSISRNGNVGTAEIFASGLLGSVDALTSRINDFPGIRAEALVAVEEQLNFLPGGVNHPVTMATDVVDEGHKSRSDDNREGGNIRFGALRANIEDSADLAVIELQVRGDPYWLGSANGGINLNGGASRAELAQYEQGSLNFFLNVNFPVSDEDTQGRRKPNPDYQLSGVYSVTNVINSYRNGQFIQFLKATRDMATNTSSIYETATGDNTTDASKTSAQREGTAPDSAQAQEDAARRTGTQQ